jgi:hypothetical protein
MNILASIGPITFDISSLISFIIGISFGFLLLFLIYIYAMIKSLNKGLKLKGVDEQDIDEEEIKWLIKDAQKQFKDKEQRTEIGYYKYLLEINKELSIDIAKKFYPKSKYPYLELTIDETLLLNHYITDRFQELLKGRILRLTRGLTLSKLVEMNEFKEKVDNNPVVKAAKKYSGVTRTVIGIANIVNPVYWGRRLTQDILLQLVYVKIGLAVIAITGEETYKIYSKKVFDEEKTIDAGVDEIYKEIESAVSKNEVGS